MSKKRASGRDTPGASAKRRKLETSPSGKNVVNDVSKKVINAPQDLQVLLFFDQESIPTLYKNILQFEEYVRTLRDNTAEAAAVQKNLLSFLHSGFTSQKAGGSSPIGALFQCWSFAANTEHEKLLHAIPAALSTLLSSISDKIEFREAGLRICHDLLEPEQFTCIEKSLKPNRQKAGVVIGALRVLTQIVRFDGGALARRVYRQGDTYRQLETLLSMSAWDGGASERKKNKKIKRHAVSIRDSAVRFLLANLHLQSANVKAEIIFQGHTVRNLVKGLENDPPSLIREVLTVTRLHVLQDSALAAFVKTRFLLEATLTQIARLYQYDAGEAASENEDIPTLAHEFLLTACVSRDVDTQQSSHDLIGSNIENEWLEVARDRKSRDSEMLVKRKSILILLSKLRPHAMPIQKSLVLAIFQAHPYLVHDYFEEATFQFDPKLTATWVGYASFLLSVVMLPLPDDSSPKVNAKLGGTIQLDSIRDSILPPSLNRDVLERCLNLRTEPLISFFATRLLIAAFQKVESYLDMLRGSSPNFKKAGQSMLDWFCERCPRGRVVADAYRLMGLAYSLQKEQLSRLLLFYYSLAPRLAVDAKLDIGTIAAEALDSAQSQDSANSRNEIFQMQISHLLRIASLSPAMRWWNPPGKSLSYSPFVSVFRAYLLQKPRNPEILDLLKSVLKDNSMLQPRSLSQALDALVKSFDTEIEQEICSDALKFLENCFFHLSKHELKYTSLLFELVDKLDLRRGKEMDSFSPLSVTIGEQWAFAVAAKESNELLRIAEWAARYFEAMDDIGESRTILRSIRNTMAEKTADRAVQAALQQALPESKRLAIHLRQPDVTKPVAAAKPTLPTSSPSTDEALSSLRVALDASLRPPPEPETHPELTRWRRANPSDALDDGLIAQLARKLASPHAEIRVQSLAALRAFIPILQQTSLRFQPQLYLLLNELVESAAPTVRSAAFPAFAAAIAAAAIPILQTPLHCMYAKINEFLLQRPQWNLAKLPATWMHSILQTPPSQPGMQSKETAWLLERLIEGLRTPADVELYRSTGVVERLLARCPLGLVSETVAARVVHLLYRLTFFESGSTALMTRGGGLAWLEGELARCRMEEDGSGERSSRHLTLLCLLDRLAETCDLERMERWSGGQFDGMVVRLKKLYG